MTRPWTAEELTRAAERRTRATCRIARQGADEAAFDRGFWRSIAPEERVAMLWGLVLEARRIRGEPGDEPPLRRDILRVVRP